MNNITPSNNFFFTEYKYDKYHYTDNTKGSPMNYIGFMAKGTAKIVSNEKTLHINTGDLFFIPKRLSYKSYWYGEESIELLSLGFLNIEARDSTNCVLQTIKCSDKIKNLIIAIPTGGRYPKCETLAQFYYVLSKVLPNLEKAKKKRQKPKQ